MTKEKLLKVGKDLVNFTDKIRNSYDNMDLLNNSYTTYWKHKNDKKREINQPSETLMPILKSYTDILRQVECPPYNYAGYKGQSAYKNALAHVGNFAYLTTDINHYYPNTQAKYVREFLEKDLNIKKDDYLEFLIKLFTYNGYLPTGAPTSSILALLTHKKLFDKIYRLTQTLNINFTLYYDDITLSAKHGITNDVLENISDILAEHELTIKHSKTQHYSYRKALITGYYVHQSGKISVPDKVGHSVIKILKEKSISDMSLPELRSLIGKINHIRYIDKNAFQVVRDKTIKQLKKIS